MTDEMKPVRCGCGGEAEVIKHTFHGASPSYGVECTNCHAESWQFYDTEAEAITAWNRAMGSHTTVCTTEDGVYTSGCTITNTSSPNEDFHPVRDCMVGAERTVKVDELCGKWGKCECGADVFRPDTEGWKYCPYCGARLEWE